MLDTEQGSQEVADAASPPRWLADEMLGRLARYLRFFGHDVVYLRGMADTEIVRIAERESRTLLTRDRELARRVDRSLLLRGTEIGALLREVREAAPAANYAPRFDRCPECNHPLVRWAPPAEGTPSDGLPWARLRTGLAIYECPACRQRFWDGSHAERIRQNVRTWLTGPPRP